jgi:hypothetical protein
MSSGEHREFLRAPSSLSRLDQGGRRLKPRRGFVYVGFVRANASTLTCVANGPRGVVVIM